MRQRLIVTIFTAVACACAYTTSSQERDKTNESSTQAPAQKPDSSRRRNDQSPFRENQDPAAEAAARQYEHDESAISARTVNRFHLAIIARLLENMPRQCQLSIQYGGIVVTDDGNRNFRVHGSIGNTLEWTVSHVNHDRVGLGNPIFNMMISTKRTGKTLATCRLGDDIVFVSVSFIQGRDPNDPKSLDEPLAELGMFSVRKTIQLLQQEPGDLEKAE